MARIQQLYSGLGQVDSQSASYISAIGKLKTEIIAKNWSQANTNISSLLVDPNLTRVANSLIEPLQYIQKQIADLKDGEDGPSDTLQTLSNLEFLASAEAAATPNDRLVNKQLLLQRLNMLSIDIQNFFDSTTKFKAIWNRIFDKEEIHFLSLKKERDDLGVDIKTMPLTPETRTNLQTQFANLLISVAKAQRIAEADTLTFVTRSFVLIFLGSLAYATFMILTKQGMDAGIRFLRGEE